MLQVNRTDLVGGRFSCFNLADEFEQRGVDATYAVWDMTSKNPRVEKMLDYPGSRPLTRALHRLETEMSMHAVLPIHSHALPMHRSFQQADIVHYHIIHDGYFSLLSLPHLSHLKPSVWTWHDPWPMTGHCIYPMSCDRWKSGCGACPDLNLHFPMATDKTLEAAAMKKRVLKQSNIDVVLASKFMMSMAQQSFVGSEARLHHIPFGVDLNLYRERNRQFLRRKFGIPDENVVVCLRSFSSTFKGLEHTIGALDMLQTKVPISILGFQEYGHFNQFMGRYQIIELGWVDEDELMVDALSVADIFAMPSKAEAFGMMAVEAMACSKPVVVFEGTSLPEVVFAPDPGVAVPMGDTGALAEAFRRLIENPEERLQRGRASRKIAEDHYEIGTYTNRLVDLYRSVIERRRLTKNRV